jgi:hypothetical protein
MPLSGCGGPPFPRLPLEAPQAADDGQVVLRFDVDGDGRAEFFEYLDESGRIARLGFDDDGDGRADAFVDRRTVNPAACPHAAILLDGFAYDVVEEYRRSGGLRAFRPPSRLIAPYPTLTDVVLEDLVDGPPLPGFEALYFDPVENRLAGGTAAYMHGLNGEYNGCFDYRASLLLDPLGYVFPGGLFGLEIDRIAGRLSPDSAPRDFFAYVVSSAGLSTRRGREGQWQALRELDRMVDELLWRHRGRIHVTLLSDHGHSYTPARPVDLGAALADRGWQLRESLRDERDVVWVRFGVVTYASLNTRRPADLAADAVAVEGVELTSYADGRTVVVLAPGGQRARIERNGDRYAYRAESGDPLELQTVLGAVAADAEGFRDAEALFAATSGHRWPAPLQRLWRAHFALVEHPPDVICSLADDRYSGSGGLAGAVQIRSTHGSLNRINSTAFVATTLGHLPPALRTRDLPAALTELLGRRWPACRVQRTRPSK